MIALERFLRAEARIHGHILETPLLRDDGRQLLLKLENRQRTGSFKLRGALSKVLSLEDGSLGRGLVAASAGNHGQGVAHAARLVGTHAHIFVSRHAPAVKVAAMQALGAEVAFVEGGYGEAEAEALGHARTSGEVWISPYNDEEVICGQGTIGLEIVRALPELRRATVIIPAGGGGLAAGIGCVVRAERPGWRVIAVQSEASSFLFEAFHGRDPAHVVERPSLADGLSGPVQSGSITLPLVREVADEVLVVSEEGIERAIAEAWVAYGERIEGSAAVSLAAALQLDRETAGPTVLVLSGANIDPSVHLRIVERWPRGWAG